MKIGITGEKGFIAKNFPRAIKKFGHEFVSLDNCDYAINNMNFIETGEVCVYSNSTEDWANLFKSLSLDAVIHNAAVVGTDVVALNPEHSINTNLLGTKRIIDAANISNMLTVYTGTTVIYDTYKYQESDITENSEIMPRTDYAVQKLAAEYMVKNNSNNYLVTRPLFAYGGVGDMNSLIAKTLFGLNNNIENIDIFLNPDKIKDYMHVEDFCNDVMMLIDSDVRNNDFNITAENPHNTREIMSFMEEVTGKDLSSIVKWHPETDYLGNHRLTNKKFKEFMGSTSKRSLKQGIAQSWESIKVSNKSEYNPLKYLEEAKNKDFDLLKHFPRN